jgi:hypothetical protein
VIDEDAVLELRGVSDLAAYAVGRTTLSTPV